MKKIIIILALLVNYAFCEQEISIIFTDDNNRPSIEIINQGKVEISIHRMSHTWQDNLLYSKDDDWIISTVPAANAAIENKLGPGEKVILNDEFHSWHKRPVIGLKVGMRINNIVVWSNEYAEKK